MLVILIRAVTMMDLLYAAHMLPSVVMEVSGTHTQVGDSHNRACQCMWDVSVLGGTGRKGLVPA